jgi:biotin synthase
MDKKIIHGDGSDFVNQVGDRVYQGDSITFEESLMLLEREDYSPYDLFHQANRIREKHFGNRVHFCSIVNAKSGNCSEDCGFCAQSALF